MTEGEVIVSMVYLLVIELAFFVSTASDDSDGTGKFFYFVSQVTAVVMGVFAYGLWELFK